MLIYILVEIVEYLLNNNIKEINIDCEKIENKTVLKICNENFASSVLEKIKKIAALEEDINIDNNANSIIIVTKNTINSVYNPQ